MNPDVVTILLNQQNQMLDSIVELRKDVSSIKATLAEQRGARRVGIYLVTTFGGIVGALLTAFAKHFGTIR